MKSCTGSCFYEESVCALDTCFMTVSLFIFVRRCWFLQNKWWWIHYTSI